MTFIRKHQKIILYASIFLLVVVGVGLIIDIVQAAPSTATKGSLKGAATGAALGFLRTASDALIGIFILAGILWGLSLILNALFVVASIILNFIFQINVLFNPVADSVVIEIWGYARDIANAVFILIVLWIAFTIIFNLENLGGKKLLVKVIVVALLINFSLAFVGAVFGFTNQLALPFKNAISEKGDVAGVITTHLQFQTMLGIINDPAFFSILKKKAESPPGDTSKNLGELKNIADPSFAQYLGIKETQAVVPLVLGLLAALLSGVAFVAGAEIAEFGLDMLSWLTGGDPSVGVIPDNILKLILNFGIINIFLLLLTFAFVTAAIVLMGRLIAMFFLATLAPFALLAAAVPSAAAQALFSSWLKNLVKWAFFAPAFYFLLYLSIRVLVSVSSGAAAFWSETADSSPSFQGNLLQLFNLTLFVAFIWASIIVSRKMGITVADGFVNWGQKWAKAGAWYGPAVAGRAALGGLRRLGARAGQLERKYPRTPLMPTPVRKAFQRFGVYERDAADEARKKLKPLSSAEIQRRSSMPLTTSTERGAGLLELTERGDVEREPGVTESQWGTSQIQQGIRELRGKGKNIIDILRARPDLATSEFVPGAAERAQRDGITPEEAAIRIVVEGIRPAHIQKMERQAIITARDEEDTPAEQIKQQTRKAFWRSPDFQPEHLGQMVRTDPRMSEAMIRELETILADPAVTQAAQAEKDRLRARFERYLTGALAQGLIRVPSGWGGGPTPPESPPTIIIPPSFGGGPRTPGALGGAGGDGAGGRTAGGGGGAAGPTAAAAGAGAGAAAAGSAAPAGGGTPFRPVAGGAPTRAEEAALKAAEKAGGEPQTQTPAPAEEIAPKATEIEREAIPLAKPPPAEATAPKPAAIPEGEAPISPPSRTTKKEAAPREEGGGREPIPLAKPPPDITAGKTATAEETSTRTAQEADEELKSTLTMSEKEAEYKREVRRRFTNDVSIMERALQEGKAPNPAYTSGKIKEAKDIILRVEKELRDAGYKP